MFRVFVYTYFALLTLFIFSSASDDDESVDDDNLVKIDDDDDSFENDEHKPTIFELVELGRNVTRTLKNPTPPGHKFVRDLFVYWEDISWLRTFVRLNRTDGRIVYKAILKQGGPPFLKVDFEDSTLLNAFNWTRRDIREVRETIREIDVIWSHMDIYLENEDDYMAPTFYSKRRQ